MAKCVYIDAKDRKKCSSEGSDTCKKCGKRYCQTHKALHTKTHK